MIQRVCGEVSLGGGSRETCLLEGAVGSAGVRVQQREGRADVAQMPLEMRSSFPCQRLWWPPLGSGQRGNIKLREQGRGLKGLVSLRKQ